MNTSWLMLVTAGLLEVGMAIALKSSQGFSRPLWSVLFGLFAIGSFGLLSAALRTLPVGTAYAVWTGIGAAGTALMGMFVLGEGVQAVRLVCIGLIVAGVVGLQLSGGSH